VTPRRTVAVALASLACVVLALGVHRARDCQLNLAGNGSNYGSFTALGAGILVAVATGIVLNARRRTTRIAVAVLCGALFGAGAFVFEGLSWAGACG
jgi:hypothetical protein